MDVVQVALSRFVIYCAQYKKRLAYLRGAFCLWCDMSEQDTQTFYKPGDLLPNGLAFDPTQHKVLKNGVIQDTKTGRFLTAPAPEFAPITRSNAKALATRRWEEAREAFAAGFAEGMTGAKENTGEAWGRVAGKAAELLKDAKSARGFADLARFAGESAGFVPLARGRDDGTDGGGESAPAVTVIISQLIANLMTDPAPAADDHDVIDGVVSDGNG